MDCFAFLILVGMILKCLALQLRNTGCSNIEWCTNSRHYLYT